MWKKAFKNARRLLEEVVAFWTRLTEQLRPEKRLLELRIQALEKQLYGSRSEKISVGENQLALSSTVFVQVEPPVTADVVVPPDLEKVDRKKPMRRAGPENIQVVEERLEPVDKTCHRCGKDRCLIREEASERLDLIPAQLIRRRTLRPVYGCNCGKDQSPVQAPMPTQVIEKGLCDPGLLTHVVLAKDLEHRPLYRVQQELARSGVEISRTTLVDWVDAAAVALEPIYKAIRTD